MLLANEHVAAFLAGRNRAGALPRPRAARPAVDRAAAREARPTSACRRRPCPDVLSPQAAAELAGEISRRVAGVRRAVRPRQARRSRSSSCARSSGRATTRATSATRGSRARRTATSPRRSAATPTSSSTGRCCASSASATIRCRSELDRARRAHVGARARGGAGRVPRRRDLPRVAARGPAARARLGGAVGGRDHRPDRLRAVRALRRGVRGLPAGAAAAGRVLRAEHAPATALVGRRSRPHATGSATRSRCGSSRSRRGEGKVELALVDARAAAPASRPRRPGGKGKQKR